jgi:hypothetical protein
MLLGKTNFELYRFTTCELFFEHKYRTNPALPVHEKDDSESLM